jgi:deoxycytidine triphosphate deaminase
MATLLSDADLKKLIGTVIIDGDASCIRPNSYILRLGEAGEFLNSGKEFELGKKKKGIRVQPGHSVAVTALETVDFRRETVHKLFPDCDLHAFISPTTDLSREGIGAATTQIDAGYHGTLNWTISNTSSQERRFIFQERLFRLTIFKLAEGETPEQIYSGDYQGQLGYVRSQRKGAPTGMRDNEWEDSVITGGPEELLDNLIKSGYPWHVLGERLKVIDQQLKTVTNEYAEIHDSIQELTDGLKEIRSQQGSVKDVVKSVVQEEATNFQNRWLIGSASLLLVLIGLIISVASNPHALQFLKENGAWLGIGILLVGIILVALISRRPK